MNILDRFLHWVGRPEQRMQRCGADRGNLASDQSGAIMIAGVFMAALLAAGVFYLIGMGNAIVYRERLQDAADAVAFTSAGIHARGMNIIVLINLIMAALLAVLIMMRMIIVMLGIAITACAICLAATIFCGPLLAVCAPAQPIMIKAVVKLNQGANKYEKLLNTVLPILSGFEKVVAVTTPYVGAYKGNQVSKNYKPLVTSGVAVSPSMVPFVPSSKKLGLPVQDMEWKKFCGKSADLAVKYGLSWIKPDFIATALSWLASAVASTFSGYFCGGDSGALQDVMDKSIKDSVSKSCSDQKKDCASQGKKNPPAAACSGDPTKDKDSGCMSKYCNPIGGGLSEFNGEKCKKETTQTAKDEQAKSGFDPKGGGMGNTKNKTPKEIWEGAEHGSIWFQVFGLTGGDEKWPRSMDKGFAVATKSGQIPKVDASWGNWRFAQAEFYFDDSGSWSDLKEECMWKMYWRVRLRRFAITGLNLGQLGIGKIFDKIKEYVDDKWMGKALGGGGSVLLGGIKGKTYEDLSDKLKDVVTSKLGKGIDAAADNWVMPSWEVIH